MANDQPPITHVYHITTRGDWNDARATGQYRADSLETEGFIHCSKRDQVTRVANTRFAGREGLVLLAVNLSRVEARVVFENTEGGSELFPHIYGPIAVEAVDQLIAFESDQSGRFKLPAALPGDGDRN